jgi:hypothetical protein
VHFQKELMRQNALFEQNIQTIRFRLRKLCNFRRDARMSRSWTTPVINHVGYFAVVAQGNVIM